MTSVVKIDPEIMSGAPCFAGTRVPIQTLIDHLEAGDSIEDFLDGFPSVSRAQVIAFLEEAKERSSPPLGEDSARRMRKSETAKLSSWARLRVGRVRRFCWPQEWRASERRRVCPFRCFADGGPRLGIRAKSGGAENRRRHFPDEIDRFAGAVAARARLLSCPRVHQTGRDRKGPGNPH